jgi:hypothetical protein
VDRGVDNNDDPDIVDGKMYEVTAPPSAAPTPTFGDVPLDHVFWREIESIYRAGITTSCSQNPMMFFPNALITRGQMAVLLLRGKHISNYTPPRATGAFSDVPTNYWAADWIEQLAVEGITSGCSVTPMLYCPTTPVTRDQMAVFLVRAFGLPPP